MRRPLTLRHPSVLSGRENTAMSGASVLMLHRRVSHKLSFLLFCVHIPYLKPPAGVNIDPFQPLICT